MDEPINRADEESPSSPPSPKVVVHTAFNDRVNLEDETDSPPSSPWWAGLASPESLGSLASLTKEAFSH